MDKASSFNSQSSVELDILRLSQRWESQRTICNGDTPGQALKKGPRPALAAVQTNVLQAANPCSITLQSHAAAASKTTSHQRQQRQQKQQASVRFAADAPTDAGRWQQHAACRENLAPLMASTATPASEPPTAVGRAAGGAASRSSPSPLILFRGRLSFAAEADSARKFDRPATSSKRAATSHKRKLLISPGADITAAFPSLVKPAAKQRRYTLGTACPSWSARAAAAEKADAADGEGSADGSNAGNSAQTHCWSGHLPLPAVGHAAEDQDMQDTAASPASSGGGGSCCSPSCGGGAAAMQACCGYRIPDPQASLSPLPGCQQQHVVPTVEQPDCGFPSVNAQTVKDLLTHGPAAFGLSSFVVVDCRYDFEHQGGRIPGAIHLTTPEEVSSFLQQPHAEPDYWQRTAIIFHCEFSTERGPRAAKWVRNKDREAHLHDYPALSHPHVFVLQGGYKAFWKAFPELCEGGYIPMDHPDYTEELKVCHNVVKKAWAKTTRTYSRKQQQRRPSYRLRQSTGARSSGGHAVAAAAGAAAEFNVPHSLAGSQHCMDASS